MLDKYIRNIDASVELLEDRIKDYEKWCLLVWIFATVLTFIGALIHSIILFGGGILFALCGVMFYSLLLYLEILVVLRKMQGGSK